MSNIKYLFRRIAFRIYSKLPRFCLTASNTPIDLIIPVINKDLLILPLCLSGVRSCLKNKIENIYIVAPSDPEIISFCQNNGLIYIDELSVIGYGPKQINLVNPVTGANRSGWLFQQLLKLSGNIGTCQHFLCIDADHVLLQPHVFVDKNDKFVFYMSSERHQAYYSNIAKLMAGKVSIKSLFSYVAHKMIFDKQQLEWLKNAIEKENNLVWDVAIMNSIDKEQESGFSEFELYGNAMPDKCKHLRPWDNLNLKYTDILSYEDLQKKYAAKYKAVTFSEWMNN